MVDFKKALMNHWRKVFEEHFKMPLHLDEGSIFIVDANEQMVFECALDMDNSNFGHIRNLLRKVVAKLNGESNEFLLADAVDPFVYVKGEKLLEVRGWGFLTSPNCEGLSEEAAMEYQKKLCQTCVKILGQI